MSNAAESPLPFTADAEDDDDDDFLPRFPAMTPEAPAERLRRYAARDANTSGEESQRPPVTPPQEKKWQWQTVLCNTKSCPYSGHPVPDESNGYGLFCCAACRNIASEEEGEDEEVGASASPRRDITHMEGCNCTPYIPTGSEQKWHGLVPIRAASQYTFSPDAAPECHNATTNGLWNKLSTGEKIDIVLACKNPNLGRGFVGKMMHTARKSAKRLSHIGRGGSGSSIKTDVGGEQAREGDVEAGFGRSRNFTLPAKGEIDDDNDNEDDEDKSEELMHQVFQRNALDIRMITVLGLKIEKVYSQCNKYIFTLIHAPFPVLCQSAENLGYFKRLKYKLVEEVDNGKFKDFLKGDLDKKYDGTFGHDATDIVLKAVSRILPRFAAKVLYTHINTSADNDEDVEEDIGHGTCGCKGADSGTDSGTDDGGDDAAAAASSTRPQTVQRRGKTKNVKRVQHFDSFKPRTRGNGATVEDGGGGSSGTGGYEFQSRYEVQFHDCFQDFEKPHSFFKPAQRIELAWGVLKRSKQRSMEVQYLISKGVYIDAYSLHDGNTHREDGGLCITISSEEGEDADHYRSRAQLQRIWGNLRLFFKPQPLEAIRQYFGSKIAMYYLWLNVYTAFLWPPAIFGVLCLIYGIIYAYAFETDDVHEFCNVDENGVAPYISPLTPENMTFEYNHTICAVCPTCVPANMSDMCGSYKLARVFDNEATILFGVFMAVWSVTFLDFWKRIRASHVMRWNFRGMSETGEAVGHKRSQFVGKMDWFAQYVENDDDVDGNPVVGLGSKADVPSGRHPKYYKVRKSSVIDKTYTLLEVAKKILRLKSRNDMFNPAEVKAYAEQLLSCNSSAKKGTAAGLGFKSVHSAVNGGTTLLLPELLRCKAVGCYKEARPTATKAAANSVGQQTCSKHEAMSSYARFGRYSGTWGITLFLFSTSFVAFFSIMIFRMFTSITLAQAKNLPTSVQQYSDLLAVVIASSLDVVAIVTLDVVYRRIAKKLTDWENHRTQEKYESYLYTKVFVFEFVNYNATLLYLAFIKGRFAGVPGSYGYYLPTSDADYEHARMETCPAYGCQFDVTIQLAMIFIVKSWIQNATETFVPKIKNFIQKAHCCACLLTGCRNKFGKKHADATSTKEVDADCELMPWESNFKELSKSETDFELFDDYRELVMQFGFLSLFITTCPVAPLFALLMNVYECRIDGSKMLCDYRRPYCVGAANIGIWESFLSAIAWVSLATTGGLMAFTSSFIPRLVFWYQGHGNVVPEFDIYDGKHKMAGFIERTFPESSIPESVCEFRALVSNMTTATFDPNHLVTDDGRWSHDDYISGNYTGPAFEELDTPWYEVEGWDCGPCRFASTRESGENHEYGVFYWQIVASRLAYFVVFEHFVFLLKAMVITLVDDVPRNIERLETLEAEVGRRCKEHFSKEKTTSTGPVTGNARTLLTRKRIALRPKFAEV